MTITTPLILNAATEVNIEGYRLVNEEWSLSFLFDTANNLYVEIPTTELEDDDSVESTLIIYVVDSFHASNVEDWMIDHYSDLIDAERNYNSYSSNPLKPLQRSVVIHGVEYFIYSCYEAD